MVTFREARSSDVACLARFARRTFREAYSADMDVMQIETHLSSKLSDDSVTKMLDLDTFILAEKNSELIGYFQIGEVDKSLDSHLGDFSFGENDIELRRAYVTSDCQSIGIGAKLMSLVLSHKRIMTNANVVLTVWGSNVSAQKFYKKYDFQKIGEFPEHGSDGTLDGYEFIMLRSTTAES